MPSKAPPDCLPAADLFLLLHFPLVPFQEVSCLSVLLSNWQFLFVRPEKMVLLVMQDTKDHVYC